MSFFNSRPSCLWIRWRWLC